MTTKWTKGGLFVCSDDAVGDAFAAIVAFDVGDPSAFTAAPRVTKGADTYSFLNAPFTVGAFALVEEFFSAGPWLQLNALGVTDAQIVAAQAAFPAYQLGDAAIRTTWDQFLADNGYTIVEEPQ